MSTSHIDIVRANFGRRTDIQGELRQIDEAATTDSRSYTDVEAARIEELRSELGSIDDRIRANLDMEARSKEIEDGITSLLGAFVDREAGQVTDVRSVGDQFASDEFRSWVADGARGNSPAKQFNMDFRAVTNTTTGSTSGGAFIRPDRLTQTINDFLDRRVFLTDLLPSIRVNTGSVEIVQDASPLADMANKAAETTESSGSKPQAGITTAIVTEPVATIAAWANLTRQVAEDSQQVVDYLDGRLRYSLKRRMDAEVISGDGTAPNISGLTDRTGTNTYAPGAAEARYKSIRHMIRLMEDDEAVPEIIVLNPADAEIFDLSNEATDGLHAVPNVADPGARTAWGLTQVRSTAVTAGTAVLLDPLAVAILDRQQATAYMTDSHASLFINNVLTLLLELRAGLAVFQPAGIGVVTFNGTV